MKTEWMAEQRKGVPRKVKVEGIELEYYTDGSVRVGDRWWKSVKEMIAEKGND